MKVTNWRPSSERGVMLSVPGIAWAAQTISSTTDARSDLAGQVLVEAPVLAERVPGIRVKIAGVIGL